MRGQLVFFKKRVALRSLPILRRANCHYFSNNSGPMSAWSSSIFYFYLSVFILVTFIEIFLFCSAFKFWFFFYASSIPCEHYSFFHHPSSTFLYLFHLPYLGRTFLLFFHSVAKKNPVSYYIVIWLPEWKLEKKIRENIHIKLSTIEIHITSFRVDIMRRIQSRTILHYSN